MSIRTVITEGLGSFGTIPDVIRQGFSAGIGVAEEEAGIGLAPVAKPVDYIFHDGWHPAIPRMSNVTRIEERRAVRTDNAELTEMMDLYSRWKRAA